MKNNIEIKENERIDDLHRNGYLLIQNTKMFCFGIDAVLLSVYYIGVLYSVLTVVVVTK